MKLFRKLKSIRVYIPRANESIIDNAISQAIISGLRHQKCIIPGKVIVLIESNNYDHLINALAEADQWTGFPYSQKVFENARIIKN